MRDYLVIFVNGRRHEVRGETAFKPLTDWLRYDLHLTGTKVVCAEGDCGSCTILLGRAKNGTIEYSPVCGCIQYLFQLDAAHIVTIEGLKYDGQLNPVQQSFMKCHGAQCGFCTPGFVVAMHSLLESGAKDECAVRRGLTGNLCRCTGYEPILRAAAETDVSQIRRIDELYPRGRILEEMEQRATEAIQIIQGAKMFLRPSDLTAAVRMRPRGGAMQVIAGGTDLGVKFNKKPPEMMMIFSTAALPGFGEIKVEGDHISVGANVTLSELQQTLQSEFKELADYLEWFGSPQIRNAGTLAGNLANASPIGDMIPPLFVLDAQVILVAPTTRRAVNINDFYTGYRQTVMQPEELIERVVIPIPRADEIFKLYKVSKRKDLDISTFSAAVWMRLRDGVIIDARIAYGGVGPTVIRLRQTENELRGKRLNHETLDAVSPTVLSEITPISDVRGSAEYRNLLAGNILRKFFLSPFRYSGRGPGGEQSGEV